MWILLLLRAFAADPSWAGVPLSKLPALQLAEPSLSERVSMWQASDAHQGWVRMRWYPTAEAAQADFGMQATTATTIPQAPLSLPGADEALGDGAAWVMARSRNVILFVRSQDGGAATRAKAVLGQLVPDGSAATVPAEVDPVTWDGFGRRRVDLSAP